MQDFLWNLILFLGSLGILVTIHESGHFFAARFFGVKVYTFSLGFGPVLYSWTSKRSGVRYVISAFPFGGYVKMKGEASEAADKVLTDRNNVNELKDKALAKNEAKVCSSDGMFVATEENADPSSIESIDNSDSFAFKKVWQRMIIVAAGPICNIILAFFLYICINMMGIQTIKPFIGPVLPDTPMAQSGVQTYDLVKKIANKEVSDWQEFFSETVANVGEKVPLVVAGDFGKEPERHLTLNLSNFNLSPESDLFNDLGFSPSFGRPPRELTIVAEGSAADKAGIKEGDIVLSVNGQPTNDWFEVSSALNAYQHGGADNMVDFEIDRKGEILNFKFAPDVMEDPNTKEEVYRFGVGTTVETDPSMFNLEQLSFPDAVTQAYHDTVHTSLLIVRYLEKMVSGYISPKTLSGPISIAKGAGRSASISLVIYLSFLAAISINLGILNLLPLPVLDGGQLVFLAYEGIFKRKPNEKLQNVLVVSGMVILLSLTAFAIYNDLMMLW